VLDVPGGYHTSDLVTANNVNPGCAKVQQQVIAQIKEWVGDYPGKVHWPWWKD
jgi:hypothetical protein